MVRKKIAIYSPSFDSEIESKIDKIKNALMQNNVFVEDIALFTKDLLGYRPKYLNLFYDFYLSFYDGAIIFLNKIDMIDRYATLNSEDIYLFNSDNTDIASNIRYQKLL